jgi:predicted lipoprotein with Yx(FWY)xxD motif
VAAPIAAAALVLAACSSSTKPGTATGAGTGSATSGAAAVTVATRSAAPGTFLTDGSGRALYMFASDTSSTSTCSSTCATYWPPLSTTGTPTAAGSATGSMLATITRADGSKQVTYNGHPLYLFKLDTAPGDTKGQGSTNFGAKWWLLAPSGQPITSTSSGTSYSGGY